MVIEQRGTPESAPARRARWRGGACGRCLPRRWRWRLLLAVAVAAYYLLWALTAFDKVNPTDLDIFFLPAVRIALAGRPLDVYTLRVGPLYPNANGPLSLAPLTLAAWLAQARGWLGDPMLRRMLVFVVCAPFPLLVGWEASRAVDRFGPPLQGATRGCSTCQSCSRHCSGSTRSTTATSSRASSSGWRWPPPDCWPMRAICVEARCWGWRCSHAATPR